jgi:hypothetical protein
VNFRNIRQRAGVGAAIASLRADTSSRKGRGLYHFLHG